MNADRFIVENKLWVITAPTQVPIYDFDFRRYFDCRTPYDYPPGLPGIARVGAFEDYATFQAEADSAGIRLLNTPEDQARASTLPKWYPLIPADTPRSQWYASLPTFDAITADFSLPVFVKGARQTSRHQAAASIIRNRADYEKAMAIYQNDAVLRWQQFVCREFVPLRPVRGDNGTKVAPAFEFRTFWYRDRFLGAGRYWYDVPDYRWTDRERDEALAVAARTAAAVDCGLLVVDLAMAQDGRWIVIECNDGMESGYAGVSPFTLWRALLDTLKE